MPALWLRQQSGIPLLLTLALAKLVGRESDKQSKDAKEAH